MTVREVRREKIKADIERYKLIQSKAETRERYLLASVRLEQARRRFLSLGVQDLDDRVARLEHQEKARVERLKILQANRFARESVPERPRAARLRGTDPYAWATDFYKEINVVVSHPETFQETVEFFRQAIEAGRAAEVARDDYRGPE